MKDIRKLLQARETVIGSWINTGSPVVAELMASIGFDFLVVDAEHSAVGITETQAIFQAIRAGNSECAPLVRLPGNDYAVTKKYLDVGAQGVIAPLINSKEQAQNLVDAVKYPPYWEKGGGVFAINQLWYEI